jgi:hypothetical protein
LHLITVAADKPGIPATIFPYPALFLFCPAAGTGQDQSPLTGEELSGSQIGYSQKPELLLQ